MQAKAGRVRDPPNPVRPAFRLVSIVLSSHLESIAYLFRQCVHIPAYLVIGNFGINLGRGNMFVSQHFRYGFQRYALRQRDCRSERMAGYVYGGVER